MSNPDSNPAQRRGGVAVQRLVRPVKCHFCNQPMFYSGDERHEPEVSVSVDTRGFIGEPPEYGFYAHVRCWNAKMANQVTDSEKVRLSKSPNKVSDAPDSAAPNRE